MGILSSIGSGLYDMATINPLTLGVGAYQRYQRGPSFGEFITNTPTRYTDAERESMRYGGGRQGLTQMQTGALQDIQNQGLFSSGLSGLRSLRDEGVNTLTSIPGQLAGGAVRSGMNALGIPQGEQLQQMQGQQQGYNPQMNRYGALDQLAQGLESGQGFTNSYGQLGQIGGSYFGPNAEAVGGMLGSSYGRGMSNLTNPFGVFGQQGQYKPNFQRQLGMTQTTPRYWDNRNRMNMNPGMNMGPNMGMNPMQRGY